MSQSSSWEYVLLNWNYVMAKASLWHILGCITHIVLYDCQQNSCKFKQAKANKYLQCRFARFSVILAVLLQKAL